MSNVNVDDGKRIRLHIAGESYYIIGTRNVDDGGIDFMITVPDMNKPTGAARRETADKICGACSDLSRMV